MPTRAPAASRRERRRGGPIWGVDPGASAEGLVNDESTAVTLSNPAEKDEVAAQRRARGAYPPPRPPDSVRWGQPLELGSSATGVGDGAGASAAAAVPLLAAR